MTCNLNKEKAHFEMHFCTKYGLKFGAEKPLSLPQRVLLLLFNANKRNDVIRKTMLTNLYAEREKEVPVKRGQISTF